jgi:isoquinoline 1-oxidoreductase beta subunit
MPNLTVNGVCHSVDAAPETLYGSTGELSQGLVDMPFDNRMCGARTAKPRRMCTSASIAPFTTSRMLAPSVHSWMSSRPRPARTRFNTSLRCWAARASWIRWCSVPGMATTAPRLSSTLTSVACAMWCGWRLRAPAGFAAPCASFLPYVAAVAHVAVADYGSVTVPRIDLAVDCGW